MKACYILFAAWQALQPHAALLPFEQLYYQHLQNLRIPKKQNGTWNITQKTN